MEAQPLDRIAHFIRDIADDGPRDLDVRGRYRDVTVPMTVLRRRDAVMEPKKRAAHDIAGITNQGQALRPAAGQAFYNSSKFTLRDLKARASPQQIKTDVEPCLDGFSPTVQGILENPVLAAAGRSAVPSSTRRVRWPSTSSAEHGDPGNGHRPFPNLPAFPFFPALGPAVPPLRLKPPWPRCGRAPRRGGSPPPSPPL